MLSVLPPARDRETTMCRQRPCPMLALPDTSTAGSRPSMSCQLNLSSPASSTRTGHRTYDTCTVGSRPRCAQDLQLLQPPLQMNITGRSTTLCGTEYTWYKIHWTIRVHVSTCFHCCRAGLQNSPRSIGVCATVASTLTLDCMSQDFLWFDNQQFGLCCRPDRIVLCWQSQPQSRD